VATSCCRSIASYPSPSPSEVPLALRSLLAQVAVEDVEILAEAVDVALPVEEVDSATAVDVVDPAVDSAAEAEVASQEVAAAAAFREVVAAVVVVASVDVAEEVTKSAFELFAMYLLARNGTVDAYSSLRLISSVTTITSRYHDHHSTAFWS
jgi:hypothetical protein